ncbi:MAG: hypothetical protein B5M54_05660 [Candidatus Aminicenantes bacterium 4484_214]|nr:MAG: hypothetical protein B5M54_05660 [Candidatus Aminicenantes bacterium 4484_214]RLE09498.1 MAG: hypothetical protein DRJ06_02775 [Candidatus Aminicenantes bacterium]
MSKSTLFKSKVFKLIFLAGLITGISSSFLLARGRNLGLGVILGEPTGVSFKYWTSRQTAFAGAAAWSFEEKTSFHFHLDYLFHNSNFLRTDRHQIPVYYGLGLRFKSAPRKDRFGVRVPLGINYLWSKIHLELFFEIVPVFDLTPKTDLFFNGGLGVRYYF